MSCSWRRHVWRLGGSARRVEARDVDRFAMVSVDVFDTCLLRAALTDRSLWHAVGRRLCEEALGKVSPAVFAQLRDDAETEARATSGREDVSVVEIYGRLARAYGWSEEQTQRALRIEEEVELAGVSANPLAARLLARLDAHGVPFCYVSDTPHRGEFLASLIESVGLPRRPVLTSGDIGLRKVTGKLFGRVGALLETDGRLLHVGNDPVVDAGGAARAHVGVLAMPEANANRYERRLDAGSSAGLLGPALAGASRRMRLEHAHDADPGLLSVVAGVAGPTLLAATAWVLSRAQADGLETLYFAARDGEVLLPIARALQVRCKLASDVECRYLYGSRRAWHVPAVAVRDFDAAIRGILEASGRETLGGLLDALDLPRDAREPIRAALGGVGLADRLGARRGATIESLVKLPEVRAEAERLVASAYETTVGFLRQEGLFEGRPCGLVDVGWLGRAAGSLADIVAANGGSLRCYFIGGLCGEGSELAPQPSASFLVDAPGRPAPDQGALVHLLETFCSGTEGSTRGYVARDGRFEPLLDGARNDAALAWGLAEHQRLVGEYADLALEGLERLGGTITLEELLALRPALRADLVDLWRSPSDEEAWRWGDFPFDRLAGQPVRLGELPTVASLQAAMTGAAEALPLSGPWRGAVVRRLLSRLPLPPVQLPRVRGWRGALEWELTGRVGRWLSRRSPEVHVGDGFLELKGPAGRRGPRACAP